jgi:hypothetical protein
MKSQRATEKTKYKSRLWYEPQSAFVLFIARFPMTAFFIDVIYSPQ